MSVHDGYRLCCLSRNLAWIGLARGEFFDWKNRYGNANEHNALVPREHWIEPEERQAIVDFHDKNPLEGYRRLTFLMLDQNVVAVSPSTTYRVLSAAGRLYRWKQGRRRRAPASCSLSRRTSTGTSTSPT